MSNVISIVIYFILILYTEYKIWVKVNCSRLILLFTDKRYYLYSSSSRHLSRRRSRLTCSSGVRGRAGRCCGCCGCCACCGCCGWCGSGVCCGSGAGAWCGRRWCGAWCRGGGVRYLAPQSPPRTPAPTPTPTLTPPGGPIAACLP